MQCQSLVSSMMRRLLASAGLMLLNSRPCGRKGRVSKGRVSKGRQSRRRGHAKQPPHLFMPATAFRPIRFRNHQTRSCVRKPLSRRRLSCHPLRQSAWFLSVRARLLQTHHPLSALRASTPPPPSQPLIAIKRRPTLSPPLPPQPAASTAVYVPPTTRSSCLIPRRTGYVPPSRVPARQASPRTTQQRPPQSREQSQALHRCHSGRSPEGERQEGERAATTARSCSRAAAMEQHAKRFEARWRRRSVEALPAQPLPVAHGQQQTTCLQRQRGQWTQGDPHPCRVPHSGAPHSGSLSKPLATLHHPVAVP